jgi:predicted nucleic acid-binding protein
MWAFPWTMRKDQKEKKTQDVREMQRRARLLMRMLDEQKAKVIIPSVVIAELLAGVEPQKHTKLLAEFNEHFFCPSFDIQAAPLAAKLWQFEHGLRNVQPGLPKDQRSPRNVLKADTMIIATAKLAGASVFYSHEARCRRLAEEAGMKGLDLPRSSDNWITDWEIGQNDD